MNDPQKCRAPECDVMVLMLRHRTTGNFAPIEAVPSDDGNIIIDDQSRTYIILTKEALATARDRNMPLRKNHWANKACPIVIERETVRGKAKGAAG